MWKTVIVLGCSFGAVLATPIGLKNMPIMAEEPVGNQKTEMAMSTLNLPSNATSIRADITDGFTCANKTYGYYADVENDCQIFHVCLPVVYPDGRENTFRWSFICPEETLFSQESFTCVRGEDMNFGCDESERFYDLNRNFGMSADASMEMSSMEADMDEYYTKSELASPAASRPLETLEDERISEAIVPLIKEVEIKKDTKRPLTYSDKKKIPLRTSLNKPKLETSKKPVTTTTTKRIPSKYNKIQRRPTMPQSTTVKETYQKEESHTEKITTLHQRLTTVRPVKIKDNKPLLPVLKYPSQIMPIKTEENTKVKISEDALPEQQMIDNKDSMAIVKNATVNAEDLDTSLHKDEQLINEATSTKVPEKSADNVNILVDDDIIQEGLSSKPALNQLEEEKIEDSKPEDAHDEMQQSEDVIKEMFTSALLEAETEMPKDANLDGLKTEDTENKAPIENLTTTFVKEINSPTDVIVDTEMDKQGAKNEDENEENLLNTENIDEAQKEEINSQQQEEMIIKTIAELMAAANMENTEDLPAFELAKPETAGDNLELSAVVVPDKIKDTVKGEDDNKVSFDNEDVHEEMPLSSENVQITENLPTFIQNVENSELVDADVLQDEQNNSENKENSPYVVNAPETSNILQSSVTANDIENTDTVEDLKSAEKTNFDGEAEISLSSANSEVNPAVEDPEPLPSSQEALNEANPLEQAQDNLEVLPYIPIHELLMNSPQSSFESGDEQIIPVLIVNDNNQEPSAIITPAEQTDTLHDNMDLSKAATEEEIKPLYHRIQEFHSNLLKTDLLSADLDDEPAVYDISSQNPSVSEVNLASSEKTLESSTTQDMTLTPPNQVEAKVQNSEDKINFLLQANASEDFLKVIPLVIEKSPESSDNSIPSLNESEGNFRKEEDGEVITTEVMSSPFDRPERSRRLKKKMDPRKRRFLFKADAS